MRLPSDPESPRRQPHEIRVSTPDHLYVPRMLQQQGLAANEPDTLAAILAALELLPRGTFFDIGANVGAFSWIAAALTHWEVIAFEPTPETASACRRVAADNGLDIRVEELAMADKAGQASLYLSSLTDTSNSLLEGFRPAKGNVSVEVTTVDEYSARKGAPSLLKIDTEATEPAVLRGASTLLGERRPWVVCEVLGKRTEAVLTEILQPYEYHWYQITNETPLVRREEIFGDRAFRYSNWLFAPIEPPETYWSSLSSWRSALRECTPVDTPDPG